MVPSKIQDRRGDCFPIWQQKKERCEKDENVTHKDIF